MSFVTTSIRIFQTILKTMQGYRTQKSNRKLNVIMADYLADSNTPDTYSTAVCYSIILAIPVEMEVLSRQGLPLGPTYNEEKGNYSL